MGNGEFVEARILGAVREMLMGRVNEILGEMREAVPRIEFGEYAGGDCVCPVVSLLACACSEKERLLLFEAYSVQIVFPVPETPESEMLCFAYVSAVGRALGENPTLGGVTERAVMTGKKYVPPKNAYCGEGWECVVSLRVTVERGNREKGIVRKGNVCFGV